MELFDARGREGSWGPLCPHSKIDGPLWVPIIIQILPGKSIEGTFPVFFRLKN